MNISTSNNENGTATEDIETEYTGEEIEIGFNSKYVLDMVNNLEEENISLGFKDNSSPITRMVETLKANGKINDWVSNYRTRWNILYKIDDNMLYLENILNAIY